MGTVTNTLCALNENGKNAVETSFKLLLYSMTGLKREEKNKQLQYVVPFIKNWAIAKVGEYFSCNDIQKEHQVYHKIDLILTQFCQIYSFGLICMLLMRVAWNGKKHFEIYFSIVLKEYAIK